MACGCLEFVGLKIWRIIKVIVGIAALICAILQFTPVPCEFVVAKYIIAGVLIFSALGMIIDSMGIEAVLAKFRTEIKRLATEVDRLEIVERELSATN